MSRRFGADGLPLPASTINPLERTDMTLTRRSFNKGAISLLAAITG
jgi:hypothetical protein